jgi:hypothetical protein
MLKPLPKVANIDYSTHWDGFSHPLGDQGVTDIKLREWPKPPPNHHWGWFWWPPPNAQGVATFFFFFKKYIFYFFKNKKFN